MPLMKYVFFGGSALVLLLLAMNWLLPDPTAEAVYSSTKRPVIRISSIQTLPERVVFDTSMSAPPPSVMRAAAQPRQSAFTFEQITPGLLPTFSIVTQVTPKKTIAAKPESAKKMVANRIVPQAAKNYPVREAEDTKLSVKTTFLDDIAGRFGFKVN